MPSKNSSLPAIIFKRVDLPAPFIPIIPILSPSFITIETFFNIRKEQILSTFKELSPIPHTIFNTNGGKYQACL